MKICDGHYTAAVRVLSSSGVAPYNDATLEDLKTKHPFKPPPSLPHIAIDHHYLVASPALVLDRIKSFPRGTLGEYIVSAPLTPLVKPGGGIRPIVVGTVWRRLVSKVSVIMIGHSLDGYLDGLQFGVGMAGGSEAILYSVNRLIEACGDDVGLSMLLVDLKNAFNLVDQEVMLREVRLSCLAISHWQGDPLGPLIFSLVLHPLICKIRDSFSLSLHAWYLDDGTIVGDTMVVDKVLELIIEDGPGCGLHLNVDKTKVFWPNEDPRSRLTVAKTIRLMDVIAKINDPQCELLLLRSCTGISRLYFTMRTCPPRVFESAQRSFDVALRSSLERIVIASGPGFGDWQWRLATLPFAFGGLGVYFAGDVLNYAFLASRLHQWPCGLLKGRIIPLTGLGRSLFLACSRVFAEDIYGDHRIIGIKHRHNLVRDTLVDICYRSGISAGKEVDIGLGRGRDKPLRPAYMLLYSWDGGLDVCVDLTVSSLLTQTGMVDFVPSRAVTDTT
ncbi:hypothetical protein Tco_1000918, partial [Tanacetum coccineum]